MGIYETPSAKRYPGASTGQIRLCGDQGGSGPSSPTIGGSIAEIWKVVDNWPDSKIRAMIVLSGGSAPSACTGLAATSTKQIYYTKVNASFQNIPGGGYYSGWARGEDR